MTESSPHETRELTMLTVLLFIIAILLLAGTGRVYRRLGRRGM